MQPVFGTGSGTYLYYGRHFRSERLQLDPVEVHNDYLHLRAELYAERARVALHDERHLSAMRWAQQAVALDDQNPETLFYLGESRVRRAEALPNPVAGASFMKPRSIRLNGHWRSRLTTRPFSSRWAGSTMRSGVFRKRNGCLGAPSPGIRVRR